jgi:predicted nucleic acid-binding protein
MTFIDTNVLLDVVTNNDNWADWSIAQLEAASLNGPLLINDLVYAELSVRYDRVEGLEVFLEEAGLEMTPISSGRAFPRRKGVHATSPGRRIKDWRPTRLFHWRACCS